MIKKIILSVIVVVIAAAIAHQMGWLSSKGERAYDKTKESVMEKGGDLIDMGKDAIK
jgi:flagellar basal body-associated protein FliL